MRQTECDNDVMVWWGVLRSVSVESLWCCVVLLACLARAQAWPGGQE